MAFFCHCPIRSCSFFFEEDYNVTKIIISGQFPWNKTSTIFKLTHALLPLLEASTKKCEPAVIICQHLSLFLNALRICVLEPCSHTLKTCSVQLGVKLQRGGQLSVVQPKIKKLSWQITTQQFMQIHKWIKWDDAWTNLQCTRHRNARKRMCDQSQQRDKKWTNKKRTRPAQEMTRAVVLFLIGLPGGHHLANKKPWERIYADQCCTNSKPCNSNFNFDSAEKPDSNSRATHVLVKNSTFLLRV